MSRMMSNVHAQWPKQPHRQHYPQQQQQQQQAQQYYPSAPSSAATPSLFAGTTRSSISSAYSHASPGVTHYPPPPEPDVSLDQLLESAYASDAPSPPTIDSGLLAGMDVNALVGDLNIDMLEWTWTWMHDLGLDPSHVARVPPPNLCPLFRHPSTSSLSIMFHNNPNREANYSPSHPSHGAGTNSDVERTKGEAEIEQLFVEGFPHFAYTRYWELWSCHLACSRHNHRHYAIKVLNKAKVVQQKQVEHTNSERSVLTLVRHPFIVNLWGTFQDVNNLFMVMDFVPGGELFTLLRKSRLLGADGHIKLTDFGFAKNVPDITWTLCGTPDYLAPEIVNQKSYNKSVDWYAVGILLYEMLAGAPLFLRRAQSDAVVRTDQGREIEYPRHFESGAVDLMRGLLVTDLSLRLGNMIGGSKDVFNHHWFSEVPWEKLANKEVQPPYVPQLGGDGDTSQFERYNEEDAGQYGQMTGRDPHAALFTDFGPLAF
ncbi:Extension Ser/Thr-type protein kinase [Rhizoctonia solani]|uniref:cAMP-dependent protein kinase n=1 Tax=Rhizoctonia solani TaxID=456999 RepID=A0A8H7I1U8_9AGAM|nr:Extension Ser/Thr-type protein kinase [Rhizoctonia solani]